MVSGPFGDSMNLVGLMLVRNEQWVIGASIRAALQWCDQVVLYADRCTDMTMETAAHADLGFGGGKPTGRIMAVWHDEPAKVWNEMDLRQQTLLIGRRMGGTHFAIIDADEILTANLLPAVRSWFLDLKPRQQLQVPMVPVWDSIEKYRSERCAWTYRNDLTLGFKDDPALTWQPREDGYHHHSRPPAGIEGEPLRPINWGDGGVLHLQFANKRRLLAKHVLYRMVDHLRWPLRRSVAQLNRIYDEALQQAGELTDVPADWWGTHRKDLIDVGDEPWQEKEIARLLVEHGRTAFMGLDLKGF